MHKRSFLLVLISLALGVLSCGMEQSSTPPPLTIHTCDAPTLESSGDTSSPFKLSPIESDLAWDVPMEAWARLGDGDVGSIALSPDGATLVVGTTIGIEAFTVETFERQWYVTLDALLSDLTFSPDGQYIAGQKYASDLILRQAETGEIVFMLVPYSTICSIVSPIWAPESMQMAFGSGGNVFIWDVAGNQITEVDYEPTGDVTSVAWSHDERYLAIGAEGAITTIVRLSDQQTTAILNPFDKETAGGRDASLPAFRASGMEVSELMFGQADQTLVVQVYRVGLSEVRSDTLIWDLETGKTIPIPADTNPRITAYHTPIAVSYDRDKPEVLVYNTADGSVRTSLTLDSDFYVQDSIWAAEANMVAAIIGVRAFDGTAIAVWNLDEEGQAARVIDTYGGYEGLTWQSNDTLLVEAPFYQIHRWNLVSGTSELVGRLPPKTVFELAPDFSRYVVSDCQSVRLMDISGEIIAQALHSEPCLYGRPDISGDASHAALEVDSQTIRVVDFESGSRSVDIDLSPATTSNIMALSPDGTLLAVAHEDQSVSLWNTSSGQKIAGLPAHDQIDELLFSPDASLLAVLNIANRTQFIVVWDVDSGQKLQTLTGSSIHEFAFDPQSQRIAAASYGYVVIWDVASAEIIQRISTDEGINLSSPAWSPDGKSLATIAPRQGIIIWRLSD